MFAVVGYTNRYHVAIIITVLLVTEYYTHNGGYDILFDRMYRRGTGRQRAGGDRSRRNVPFPVQLLYGVVVQ